MFNTSVGNRTSLLTPCYALKSSLNYQALASSQGNTDELKNYLGSDSVLCLEKLPIPGLNISVYCDTTTGRPKPFLTPTFRRMAFDQLHNLSHPGSRATVHLVSERFVWLSIRKDCWSWARACSYCQVSTL